MSFVERTPLYSKEKSLKKEKRKGKRERDDITMTWKVF
jgi:hypothetical protein